jgi:hypothetical protein
MGVVGITEWLTHEVKCHEWGARICEWGAHPHQPYNRPMHTCLIAHVHWLWRFLHFVKGFIYDWTTFWAFLALGTFQTLIASVGGILAVKGLEGKFSPNRRRWLYSSFIALGVVLLLITAAIGYLNDQGQHQAEVNTQQAVDREQETQDKLDRQYPLLLRASLDNTAAKQTARTGGSSSKLLGQLEDVQRALAQALAERAPAPAQVTLEANDSLSKLSDAELRQTVEAFYGHLHGIEYAMMDVQDGIYRTRMERKDLPGVQPATDPGMDAETARLNVIMAGIIQKDVPLANQYRAELLKRLGKNAGTVKEFPPVASDPRTLDRFLISAQGQLGYLANKLPAPN